ncbi:hypothetical protein [Frankia sp. QA3]|uniref:hypothetical protein n=1 Tax=Frankia sp. QA3 TaxID=710111 RepID=UPI0012FB742B|nr:hypothetical protein [Frankia sp. QA3]
MAIARKSKGTEEQRIVFAKDGAVGRYEFGTYRIHRNEAFSADHVLVLARPELFSDVFPGDVSRPDRAAATSWRAVESATRAPGETR